MVKIWLYSVTKRRIYFPVECVLLKTRGAIRSGAWLSLAALVVAFCATASAGDGSVTFQPATGILTRGQELAVSVMFDPMASTIVTGLDACVDFDPAVFNDPVITAENITDREMTNTSYGNNWPGHPDSYHYQRIALPGTTGWHVYAGQRVVYELEFTVRADAPSGQTVLTFTPGFITFSDAGGELLAPDGIGQGMYDIPPVSTATPTMTATINPTATPTRTPTASPTRTPSPAPTATSTFSPTPGPPPPVPALTGISQAVLSGIVALLLVGAGRCRRGSSGG